MPTEVIDTAEQAVQLCDREQHMAQQRRSERVTSWIGWHVPELSGIGLPLAGMAVSPWTATVSVVTGAVWAVAEWRQRHQQRQVTSADTPTVTAGEDDDREPGPLEGSGSEGGTRGTA